MLRQGQSMKPTRRQIAAGLIATFALGPMALTALQGAAHAADQFSRSDAGRA